MGDLQSSLPAVTIPRSCESFPAPRSEGGAAAEPRACAAAAPAAPWHRRGRAVSAAAGGGGEGRKKMPGKLKVKIVAGRHLPVMDRASDLTDAFVEVGGGGSGLGAPGPRGGGTCPARGAPRCRRGAAAGRGDSELHYLGSGRDISGSVFMERGIRHWSSCPGRRWSRCPWRCLGLDVELRPMVWLLWWWLGSVVSEVISNLIDSVIRHTLRGGWRSNKIIFI